MKCTTCSTVVKPVVAIDIDGTMGDYHGHFVSFLQGYFDRNFDHTWSGRPENWEDHLGLTQAEYREAKLAFRQGGQKRTMPVFPYASSLTNGIHKAGAEVWITTTRPWNRHDSVDPDTKEWLSRNKIYYDHLLYDDRKYRKLAELVDPARVVLVVDDLREQCVQAAESFGYDAVLMRYATHNRYDQHLFGGCDDLLVIEREATRRIKEWNNDTKP